MVATGRAAKALATLRAAEQRTGARQVQLTAVPFSATQLAQAPLHLARQQQPSFKTTPELAEIFPEGIPRGAAIEVTQSNALLLNILAAVHQAQGSNPPWTAVWSCPDLGWLAAAQQGVDLTRVAVLPGAFNQLTQSVLATLCDGFELIVLGETGLSGREQQKLLAKARQRGTTLISTVPWAGARLRLTVPHISWSGQLAAGYLQGRELQICQVRPGDARQQYLTLVA